MIRLNHIFRKRRRDTKKGYTLLVMPDNGKTVLSMRLPRAILYALLLIILAVIAIMYASYQLQQLYQENLAFTSTQKQRHLAEKQQLQSIIHTKEDEIALLQEQLFSLSEQASVVRSRLKQLEQLEQEIRVMVNSKVGDKDGQVKIASVENADAAAATVATVLALANSDPSYQGGPFEPVTADDISALTHDAKQSLSLSNDQIANLSERLIASKQKWMDYEEMLRITPTIYPTESQRVTSSFGMRRDPFTGVLSQHNGIDFGAPLKSHVYATADGKVHAAGYDSGKGNYVFINHENGLQTRYLHLSSYQVKSGQQVSQGDVIGQVGSTGRSTGPHLHYEVHQYGKPVNPKQYLQQLRKEL